MRVACARRNESQACSPLPLGSSRATSRWRRPATPDGGTCIRNNQSLECLHLQVYRAASEGPMTTDVRATASSFPATDLEKNRSKTSSTDSPANQGGRTNEHHARN